MLGQDFVADDQSPIIEATASGIEGLFEAASNALVRAFGGTPTTTVRPRAVSLLNPATWDMTTTLLVVGGVVLLFGGVGGARRARRRSRSNPRRRRYHRNAGVYPFIRALR